MAAIKSVDPNVKYHVTDAHGNRVALQQVPGSPNITIGLPGTGLQLTKQNIVDLLPALTAFSTSGYLI